MGKLIHKKIPCLKQGIQYSNKAIDYFTPCIIFDSFLETANIIRPKQITKPPILIKIVAAPNFSTYAAMNPPNIFATKVDNIQTPINIEANLIGASLVTTLNPTGEIHNSPMVWKKYVTIRNHSPAF